MTLAGSPYAPRRPARRAGAGGGDDLSGAGDSHPHLSVEANVNLGQERSRLGFLNGGENRRRVREAMALLDHAEIDPKRVVGTLSVAHGQLVEVARALVSSARVIIFDEPTSSLTEVDAARLFEVIRRLKSQGLSVVYISHFLEEVQAVAQTVTRCCATASERRHRSDARHRPQDDHRPKMVGREIDEIFPEGLPDAGRPGPRRSTGFKAGGRFGVRGESDRFGGGKCSGSPDLVGVGPDGIAPRDLSGSTRSSRETCDGQGDRSNSSSAPNAANPAGRGLVSEDRKAEGLALGQSIEDNMTYPALGRHARLGWLRLGERRAEVGRLIRAMNVKCRGAVRRWSARFRGATSKRWRSRGCSTRRPTCSCWTTRPGALTSGRRRRFTGRSPGSRPKGWRW